MPNAEIQRVKDGSETYEQLVPAIMRSLPSYRLLELVDFARFLEAQVAQRQAADMSEAVTEDAWDRLPAKPLAKRVLRDMANEAREDYYAGRTSTMKITDEGELAPA